MSHNCPSEQEVVIGTIEIDTDRILLMNLKWLSKFYFHSKYYLKYMVGIAIA
jgi:hypothetical protein